MAEEEKTEEFMLGTELRDAIARSVVRVLPNIKWKDLARMVSEFEVELDTLHQLSQNS